MKATETIALLQQIISDYSPSDHSSEVFIRSRAEILKILQLQDVSATDKLQISGLLPPALISANIVNVLIETACTDHIALIKFIKKLVEYPCPSDEENKERMRWLRLLFDKKDLTLSDADFQQLSFAYVKCFQGEMHDISGEEIRLASALLLCIEHALHTYANEKYTFDIGKIRDLTYSTAADSLLKISHHDAKEVQATISLVEFLRKYAFTGIASQKKEFPQCSETLKNLVEVFMKDMSLYRSIRNCGESSISFDSVEQLLTGKKSLSPAAAFDTYHDHKVVRYLMFVDGACKLDEANKSIMLTLQADQDSTEVTTADLVNELTKVKVLIESLEGTSH
ncbi:metal dependent phosphohydrolase [Perkinsela sp. CCAP 1560/4]|nr:metal dependent phosphohydrolase [Perkinsela sp. CCAP 1560/4]|eukprot:KNH07133.1 metal dependent phosphohydrolase [Perkinsela sp. CCAP 1560/4]